ncbi:hypothetical protein HBN50_04925 [Halobacteriovorax sp. GB3]|uniref:hypothetical protein n=1 Tax=Halobacteriovorax sp. GB3 TaxID=2719615 RepID=UPI00235EB4BF|nr:hypothetical protein [Halobacteriovorax sp. GB3]MDD0852427.1 hypothetical protein [Halobacteriovorax sp. GB3]
MKVLALIFLFLSVSSFAQGGKEKIIYKYKKFESFDFENIVIEGETGAPDSLSISPRFAKRFKNRLPYRKNFNAEIRKGIERVR